MSRQRFPGDGPRCWCGADATFSGFCNAHYNTDTGKPTLAPARPPCAGLRNIRSLVALQIENGPDGSEWINSLTKTEMRDVEQALALNLEANR